VSPKTSASPRPERLFLLDGMALAYRAYFSFISRPLVNSRGENTSAIYGFVNTLMKLLSDDAPEHIAVVFDTKEPTFRHRMYEPYKATREKMPEDMSGQLDKLKEVVRAFNVPGIELPGYEADDVMGTLARRAEKAGIETWLVTGDKDFMQLISPLVRMYKPGKQGDEWELLDAPAVLGKFGVRPELVIEVLAIIGDKSDNVPGIRGVGEKTAIPIIQKYETLENLFDHLDEIPQKGLRQKLTEGREQAYLSRKLVTIDTDAPVDVSIEDLVARPPDVPELRKLFAELEFRALAAKIGNGAGGGTSTPASSRPAVPGPPTDPAPQPGDGTSQLTALPAFPHHYVTVESEKDLRALVRKLEKEKVLSIDTETTSTDALRAELVGISLSCEAGRAWFIPVAEDRGGKGLSPATVSKHLSPLLADPAILKVGQNIKYDMLVLASRGMPVAGACFDTMVASYMLRPDGTHNMDALAAEHLNYRTITYDDLTGTGKHRVAIREVEPEKLSEYAAEDADVTLRLYQALEPKLRDQQMLSICEEIEFPLVGVLAGMERHGIALDTKYLGTLSKELEKSLAGLTDSIHAHAGGEFNVNSTQQLSRVLFETLSLPTQKKTKTGFSTDVRVLETLRRHHPIVAELLKYRQQQKLKSTYVDALPTLVNPSTGRVHTSYNQTVALTGRLSSSDPNLQNIPIRTELGSKIRRAFVAGDDRHLILSADYSQIELRIMAHVTGDPGLTEAFRNGEDIHTTTASKVFGVKPAEVTKDMRRKAKEVNFGIMYGIGPFGLATRLDIPQAEAKEIISTYFTRFPGVKGYITATIEEARKNGFVQTLLGRKRYFPEINSRNFPVRSNAERQAINMPIQGTAADMIKIAMIRIHEALQGTPSKRAGGRGGENGTGRLNARMLLQVHDELVFEVPRGEIDRVTGMVRDKMENALPLAVPVVVDVGSGANWLEAH
jgi:DNA polymerase-1